MKISYNWLKSIFECNITPEKLAELLTSIGLEVSGITPFAFVNKDLLLGQVVACNPHPNADRLQVTQVDIGGETPLSIVCGAPNVGEGKKVVVAPEGTLLPLPNGRSLKIKTAKIRGVISEGMLCSQQEIGLGDNHDAIMILQTKKAPGTPLEEVWKTPEDFVFDIDITPNRNDATSHWGVARDIAATLLRKPKTIILTPIIPSDNKPIQVVVKEKRACPRYTSVVITGVTLRPSPIWMQYRLRAIGVRPINNIVDIINFLMFELGQPMHAFDYDTIGKKKIVVDYATPNTVFTTLDGVKHTLTGEELMVRDGEGNNLAMAGIMGGEKSKVTPKTRNILLESAYFTPGRIAHTVRQHQMQTASSFRFERGTDPTFPYVALQKAAAMIIKYAGGQVASQLEDQYTTKIVPKTIPIKYAFITRVLGQPIPKETIHKILQALEIVLKEPQEDGFTALIPPYRRDIVRPIDLVEEILRIYGLDKIEADTTFKQDIKTLDDGAGKKLAKEINLKKVLAGAQFREIYTNSIVSSSDDTTQEEARIWLDNPLGEQLDSLRQTLLMGGLESLKHNLNRKQRVLKLFETGRIYQWHKGKCYEEQRLGIWMAGDHSYPHWQKKARLVRLTDLQEVVHRLLAHHGITSLNCMPLQHDHYQRGLQLTSQGVTYAHLGEVKHTILDLLEIKEPVFFAEVNLHHVLSLAPNLAYTAIPKSPATMRDLSFVIDASLAFAEVKSSIMEKKIPLLTHWWLVDTYTNPDLGAGKKSYTIRLCFQHPQKTLQEQEVKKWVDGLAERLKKSVDASIR